MKNLVRIIARAMVDNPEEVSVLEIRGSQTIVFELRVAKGDLGKVIGKKGRNAQAMRLILGAAAAKENKRVILEIDDSSSSNTPDYQVDEKEPASIKGLVVPICLPG